MVYKVFLIQEGSLRRLMFLSALALSLFAGAMPTWAAESRFAHHVDLFQAGISRDKVVLQDLGYHFTAFRIARRVELLGAGVMLDPYKKDDQNYGLNFLLTAPVADIALKDPEKVSVGDPWASLSFRYGYDFTRKDHVFLAGFSISLK